MNCLIVDDDRLCRKVLIKYVEKVDFIEKNFSVENAIEAMNFLQKKEEQIDLIFLDIEMPEMDGMEFLSVMEETPQIIIVSSREKYALDAFNYDVTDYLLKPVTFPRFMRAINRAHEKYKAELKPVEEGKPQSEDPKKENPFWIKNNAKLEPLNPDEIYYIESLENYAVFCTYNNKHTVHFTLKALMEEKLPTDKFYRIHRSYIVNKDKIKCIKGNSVELETQDGIKSLPFGKSYRDKLLNDLDVLIFK